MKLLELSSPFNAKPNCSPEDAEVFFTKGKERQAKAICADCPIRFDCLGEALAYERDPEHIPTGVWAGLEPYERRAIAIRGARAA